MYKTTGILSFLLPLLLTIYYYYPNRDARNKQYVITLDNPDEIAKEIANDLS